MGTKRTITDKSRNCKLAIRKFKLLGKDFQFRRLHEGATNEAIRKLYALTSRQKDTINLSVDADYFYKWDKSRKYIYLGACFEEQIVYDGRGWTGHTIYDSYHYHEDNNYERSIWGFLVLDLDSAKDGGSLKDNTLIIPAYSNDYKNDIRKCYAAVIHFIRRCTGDSESVDNPDYYKLEHLYPNYYYYSTIFKRPHREFIGILRDDAVQPIFNGQLALAGTAVDRFLYPIGDMSYFDRARTISQIMDRFATENASLEELELLKELDNNARVLIKYEILMAISKHARINCRNAYDEFFEIAFNIDYDMENMNLIDLADKYEEKANIIYKNLETDHMLKEETDQEAERIKKENQKIKREKQKAKLLESLQNER